MATQPVSKHDARDDRHDDRRDDRSDARRDARVEEATLVLPLAEPAGPPLVGATGVKGEHIEDGERDPDTIAEEQRRRSAAMEAGATMEEVATTDIPDPHSQGEPRRVAPPVQNQPHRDTPRHTDTHSRR